MKKIDVKTLRNLGDTLYERLKSEEKDINLLPLREYHEFGKYTVNPDWYSDLVSPEDVMVEIAYVRGPHPRLHYHKESHAYNLILGEEHGVANCPEGSIIHVGKTKTIPAFSGKVVYYPENLEHSFSAPEGEAYYFLSIQSPPLEKPDGSDDFHWCT